MRDKETHKQYMREWRKKNAKKVKAVEKAGTVALPFDPPTSAPRWARTLNSRERMPWPDDYLPGEFARELIEQRKFENGERKGVRPLTS